MKKFISISAAVILLSTVAIAQTKQTATASQTLTVTVPATFSITVGSLKLLVWFIEDSYTANEQASYYFGFVRQKQNRR